MTQYSEADAYTHTSLANSRKLCALWAKTANYYYSINPDPVTAIRKANYAVAKARGREPKEPNNHARLRRVGQRQGYPRFGSPRGY
jgi:hypothetical protein